MNVENLKPKLNETNKTLIGEIFDMIEEQAERNMMKTGKLEGMHYAALKEMREELDIPRKFKNGNK